MKKWVALLGGVMFLVLFFAMYLVVDQLGRTPSYKDVIDMQVANRLKIPLESLEKDLETLEGNLNRSGYIISRMKEQTAKIKVDHPGSSSQVAQFEGVSKIKVDHPGSSSQVAQFEGISKAVPVEQPVKFSPHHEIFSQPRMQVSSQDTCAFTRTPGNSTDVKMLNMFDMMPFDDIEGGVWKQGWDIQYSPEAFDKEHLQVFVVPHSHNDPGWIKTVDQYYLDQTRHILDNVVDALAEDKRRKFIWAEISYLSMWWKDADERRKKNFLQQVASGQMEIVTGGWVMSDEANPHYYAMIDQMIEGHQWMSANLGKDVKPVAGWAIDPFGHTPTMAYLLRRMGFESMLIQRTHYQVKKYLAKEKNLEFMWRQNWDHGSSTDILCHMMPFYSYDVPHTCGPEPAVCCQFDFARLPGGGISCPWRIPPQRITKDNVAERVKMLLDQYRKKAQLYRTNVVLAPLGDDFRYEKTFETHEQFTNYQNMFDYMNSHPELKVKAQFGTLSDYFKAVWKVTGATPGNKPTGFPTLSGDFYTYADREDHYWSGYYTSRAFYKNLDRVMEAYHRAAEILFYLASSHARRAGSSAFPSVHLYGLLIQARQNLGLFQHHDGITGTSRDHVVADYGTRLHRSLSDMQRVMRDSVHFLLSSNKPNYKEMDPSSPQLKPEQDRAAHDTLPTKELLVVSSTPRTVVLYNSLPEVRQQVVSLLVSEPSVKVTDSDGKELPCQTNLVWDKRNKVTRTKYELVFVADVQPLGLTSYKVQSASQSSGNVAAKITAYSSENIEKPREEFAFKQKAQGAEEIFLENEHIKVDFGSTTGRLKSITTKADGVKTDAAIEFVAYGTKGYGDRSGAYLFLPDGPAKPHNPEARPAVYVSKGNVMQEVRIAFENVLHVVRLYSVSGPEGKMLDIQNTVDIRGLRNTELVMRIVSNVQNNEREFYTDLNGFQMQKRKTMDKIPLQANFYPLPAMAFLQDKQTRLTLLSAQPNGVAGLQKGYLEVVLDRRLMQDDNRGLGTSMTDNKVTPSNFRLLVERSKDQHETVNHQPVAYLSLLSHKLSHHLLHPLFTFLVSTGATEGLVPTFAGLQTPLPCDVFLVTLRSIQDGKEPRPSDEALMVLHRNGYDCSYPSSCSKQTSEGKIHPSTLFKTLTVNRLQTTSLSMLHEYEENDVNSALRLNPMELHSYKLRLK